MSVNYTAVLPDMLTVANAFFTQDRSTMHTMLGDQNDRGFGEDLAQFCFTRAKALDADEEQLYREFGACVNYGVLEELCCRNSPACSTSRVVALSSFSPLLHAVFCSPCLVSLQNWTQCM